MFPGVVLPYRLSQEPVRVLRGEGGEQRPGRQTFLQFDGFGVGAELRTLVDVQDSYGNSGCGLARHVDPAGQRGLVLRLHGQHEGAGELEIYRLDGERRRHIVDLGY